MSNYTKTTDFQAKDSLPAGDSNKVIRGSEFETEFDNIATAVNSKADTANATLTGTTTFETISDGVINVTAFVDEDNMASNSATLVPTQQSVKSYVDSQITANNELSEVLSNGNTTGGSNISFGDNDKAIFGAGNDLQIYHDGSNSYITDQGTGDLMIDGTNVRLRNAGGANFLYAVSGGSVQMYHANASKLATTSTGIDVTGVITTDGMTTSADINFGDNDKAVFGAGSDLQIYHSGSHSIIKDAGTGHLVLQANDLRINNADWSANYISATNGDSVDLFFNNSKKLATTSTGIDVTGVIISDDANGISSDGEVRLGNGFSAYGKLFYDYSAGDLTIENTWANDAGEIYLKTNGNNRVEVSGNGDLSLFEDTGTTPKFFWDASAERLGLGTSSPSSPLEVAGGSAYPTTKFSRDGGSAGTQGYLTTGFSAIGYSGGTGADTIMASEHGFGFEVNAGTAAMTITDGSNVGIGTSNPSSKLQVMGGTSGLDQISLSSNLTNNNIKYAGIVMTNYGNTTTALLGGKAQNGTTSVYYGSSGSDHRGPQNHIFYTNASATATSGNTERMRLDSQGRLGLGTTSPTATLHVDGSARFYKSGGSSNTYTFESDHFAGIQITGDMDSSHGGPFYNKLITSGTNGRLEFRANDVAKMTMTQAGLIGIGTSSPDTLLELSTTNTSSNNNVATLRLTDADISSAGGQKAGQVEFYTSDSTPGPAGVHSFINGQTENTSGLGTLVFGTGQSGSASERMRIDSSGNVGIGTSSPDTLLHLEDTASVFLTLEATDSTTQNEQVLAGIQFKQNDASNANTDGGSIKFTGDGNFGGTNLDFATNALDGSGESLAMRIDSSGQVGIGTDSPSTYGGDLVVVGDVAGGESTIVIANSTTAQFARVGIKNNEMQLVCDNADAIVFGQSNNSDTSGISSERMRIDSSGNLLVGTTTADAEGITLRGDSAYFKVVRNGGITAYFDRKSSDGDIVQFRKDGPSGVVGSIGVDNNDNLTIEGNASHGGLQIATNVILPHKNGALADDTIGLGNGDNRFTELFLSGGAYLGGTAAANKLDDYEEGTFTASLEFGGASTGITYTARTGRYVKIGKLVYVNIAINLSSKGTATGVAKVTGLPFTQSSEGVNYPNLNLRSVGGITFTTCLYATANDGATDVSLLRDNGSGSQESLSNSHFTTSAEFNITGVYEAA